MNSEPRDEVEQLAILLFSTRERKRNLDCWEKLSYHRKLYWFRLARVIINNGYSRPARGENPITDTCPLGGCKLKVVSSDEGTSHYEVVRGEKWFNLDENEMKIKIDTNAIMKSIKWPEKIAGIPEFFDKPSGFTQGWNACHDAFMEIINGGRNNGRPS